MSSIQGEVHSWLLVPIIPYSIASVVKSQCRLKPLDTWLNFPPSILEHFCPLLVQTAQMGLILPRWGLILSRIPPQPLFFTQQSHTTFGNMYRAYTKHPNPSPKHPCSWPEPESLQSELQSGHPGPQLSKMFEKSLSGQTFSRSVQFFLLMWDTEALTPGTLQFLFHIARDGGGWVGATNCTFTEITLRMEFNDKNNTEGITKLASWIKEYCAASHTFQKYCKIGCTVSQNCSNSWQSHAPGYIFIYNIAWLMVGENMAYNKEQ